MTNEYDRFWNQMVAPLQDPDRLSPSTPAEAQADFDAAGQIPLSEDRIENAAARVMGMMEKDPDQPATRLAPEASYGSAERTQQRVLQDPRRRRTWRFVMRAAMASAAGLVIGAAVWFGVMGHAATVYAQVIAALDEARSMHAIGYLWQEGDWAKGMESWYDPQRGAAQVNWQDGHVNNVQIDDGKSHWSFDAVGKTSVRYRSDDPKGVAQDMLELRQRSTNWQRDPSGDKTLAGVPTQMYAQTHWDGKSQGRIWLDAAMRPLLCQFGPIENGRFQPRKQVTVEYDVKIDPVRFQPDFGPDVRTIDGERLLSERFDLDKAIFKQELLGLVLAVHEAKRVEAGVLVVYSIRPTEATNRELGQLISRKGAGSKCYGDMQVDWSWKRTSDGKTIHHSYLMSDMASMALNGMNVAWCLMTPRGQAPESAEEIQLGARIYTRDKLQEKLKAQGRPWFQEFPSLTPLPLPGESLSLRQVVSQVYADAKMLAPVAAYVNLPSGAELTPQKTMTTHYASPDNLTEEQYFLAIEQTMTASEAMLKAAE